MGGVVISVKHAVYKPDYSTIFFSPFHISYVGGCIVDYPNHK